MAQQDQLKRMESVELAGKLVGQSRFPFYDEFDQLDVQLRLAENQESMFEITVTSASQVKTDQSSPISRARFIELMGRIYHRKGEVSMETFDAPFSDRLEAVLAEAIQDYLPIDKPFAISIVATGFATIQVVNARMLSSEEVKHPGFGLHLPFDDSFVENQKYLKRFEAQSWSGEFDRMDLDDVLTYQLYLGSNRDQVFTQVQRLITNVYRKDLEQCTVHLEEL